MLLYINLYFSGTCFEPQINAAGYFLSYLGSVQNGLYRIGAKIYVRFHCPENQIFSGPAISVCTTNGWKKEQKAFCLSNKHIQVFFKFFQNSFI